jgi:uncharacterized Zn finger protein
VKSVARYYEDQWPAYVSVADRRLKAEREAGKLRKKGSVLAPVVVEGRKIASTFWGKAWCDNLESYRDYDNRLERGRSYARNGLVIDLQIAPHTVTALVCGSSLYTIKITIGEVPKAQWKAICADCAGGIDSLVELLQGRFSKGVMERICRQGAGLFPKPEEIKFSCSCQDYASMCKHVAGALYGVGARLDARPELLFRLRAVDENELVANIGDALPLSKQGPASGKVLEADDMAALFGLDMGDAAEPAAAGLLVPPVEPGANAATPDKSGGKAVARSVTPAKSVARSKETSVKSAARQKEAPVKSTARPKEPPPVQAIPEPMQRSKSGALKPAGRGAKAARPSAGRRARAAS